MKRAPLCLAIEFLGDGLAQFLPKFLHAADLGAVQSFTLVAMYVAGGLFAGVLLVAFGGCVRLMERWPGAVVGFCSYAGSFAVLRALGYLHAYASFPLVVGGPILLVALYSAVFHGERLSGNAKSGVILGTIAGALLTFG